MGIIRMGIPEEVTLFLKENFKSDVFIETGTYYGNTTLWASKHFKNVHTIEFSKEIYDITSKKYAYINNINFHFGDTRALLPEILNGLDQDSKIILWLDAHWSSGETYGEHDNCPLIKELEILIQSKHDMCILIDDARLFLAPPPLPNNYKQYPGIQDIAKLYDDDTFITVYEDVIIVVPSSLKPLFQEYLQSRTTTDWHKFSELQKKHSKGNVKRVLGKVARKLSGK